MPESATLEEGLNGGFFGQGTRSALIGNFATEADTDRSLERMAQLRNEFAKIEEKIGISAQEIMSFYETITSEDARDIVVKTIEKIPMGYMNGTLWTVENVNLNGGKIMLWAAVKSPREAAIIAASVMILTMGGWQEAVAEDEIEMYNGDNNPLDLESVGYALATGMAIAPEEEKSEEEIVVLKGGPVHSNHVHIGLFNEEK